MTLTLAFGIGANVAIFSVVNAVLLRALPYPDADRIVTIRHHAPGINLPDLESSPGLINLYRDSSRTLTRVAGYEMRSRNLTGVGQPERLRTVAVTPEFFDALAVRPPLGRAFDRVDPNVPLTRVRTMEDIVSTSLAQASFTMMLLAIAAVVAVVLGIVGLYGVISYVVSQRTPEIGVRLALGAKPGDVRLMVLRQGLTVALAGVLVGLALAASLTHVMGSLLFEVSGRDPITFIAVAVVLSAVCALAIYLPARRAAGIDPLQALREEG